MIDYTVRSNHSKQKWTYIKSHPFELIAIFQAARFVRVFRIIRLFGVRTRYTIPIYEVLRTNGLDKLLIVTTILLFLVPIPVIMVELDINT
ncbi:ion transport protein [Planococcus antarcticus DSM 14505]|uniref:Ion transport protein n=1 Tax=Planococcus antarcticus DSM 14505 TaxID=1185653 RepID=A0AA87LUX6_9BACL|nr:ion transport protein [Planococcus antarcticus DSM 14505]